MRYSDHEMQILQTARSGQFAEARSRLEAYSASPARRALLSGMMYGWQGDHVKAAETLRQGILANDDHADTAAMLFVELSQQGIYLNDRKLMREIHLRFYQLLVRFPGHPDVYYWAPSILTSLAHYHKLNMEYQRAIEVAGEALTALSDDAHQWFHAVGARLVRAWSWAELGNPEQALQDLAGARRLDRGNKNEASVLLAESLVLLVNGDTERAESTAVRAEELARHQESILAAVLVQVLYVRFLVSLVEGRPDASQWARRVCEAAQLHSLGCIADWVSRAWARYAPREVKG